MCLSTVDRRSRDRFVESSAQIAALVDKFKLEGHEYRKYVASNTGLNGVSSVPTIPLTAYGKPSSISVAFALIGRQLSSILTLSSLFKRILIIPLTLLFLYAFILPKLENQQQSFHTRSGLLFNTMAMMSYVTIIITAYTFACHRNRFYEESSRSSLYRGPLFILTNVLTSLPFSIITVAIASSLLYWLSGLRIDSEYWIERWIIFVAILWTIYTFAEQHTIAIMCFIRSPFNVSVVTMTLVSFYMILGSGTLRSVLAMGESKWLEYLNYANIYYYTGWTLHFNEFYNNPSLDRVPSISDSGIILSCPPNVVPGRCMFVNGTHFLSQRYSHGINWPEFSINYWRNVALPFVFVLTSYALNVIVYVVPLPASLKAKFRE